MDAKELVRYQLESCAHQVDKVLEGLPDGLWTAKLTNASMCPAEAVAHLTECYIAAQKSAQGEEHEWGSYIAPDDEPASLMESMRSERSKAIESLLSANNEKAFKDATQYIVLHDAYHVGQIASLRVENDKDWDPYSIY